MASLLIHLHQAKLNEEAALFNRSTHPDWTVIMCFYAAIHYIDAYAVSRGDDIYSLYAGQNMPPHMRRSNYIDDISTVNCWNDLPIAYTALYNASMKARYLKNIKTTAKNYFRLGSDYYIKKLQTVKTVLEVELLKGITINS